MPLYTCVHLIVSVTWYIYHIESLRPVGNLIIGAMLRDTIEGALQIMMGFFRTILGSCQLYLN